VVTAAQGQIEAYTRVTTGAVDGGVVVRAAAVDDVVKLLAELMDNACRYSPPDAPVRVQARWLADRVVVQVADDGIGIEPERRRGLNARLGSRPVLDLAAVRAMGLTVVGHIAARHGIAVELRAAPGGGTIAEVTLPPGLFIASGLVPALSGVSSRRPAVQHTAAGSAAVPAVPAVERAVPVRLAIFEQVRSSSLWFTTAHDSGGGVPVAGGSPYRPGAGRDWPSAADGAWRAAGRAADPVPAGRTAGGLPVRHPGAQLVPGGVNDAAAQSAGDWRDPARVSASLAAYSRGLASGRARHQQQAATGSGVSVEGGLR
jgi:hypothetical protein